MEHQHGQNRSMGHGEMKNMDAGMGHAGHGGHDHHAMMIADFRKRFWVVLVFPTPAFS